MFLLWHPSLTASISPIRFLFLKLPPPPCAVLLVYTNIFPKRDWQPPLWWDIFPRLLGSSSHFFSDFRPSTRMSLILRRDGHAPYISSSNFVVTYITKTYPETNSFASQGWSISSWEPCHRTQPNHGFFTGQTCCSFRRLVPSRELKYPHPCKGSWKDEFSFPIGKIRTRFFAGYISNFDRF